MKETERILVNLGIIAQVNLEDIKEILQYIESLEGKIIFVKKSVNKLWIKEGDNND